jgi:hypothetical protein
MARARLGGKGAAVVGKLLMPVSGLTSVALTAGGIHSAADQLVNDNSRGDLYELNLEALLNLGFSPEEAKGLLNLSHYSPREATYLRFYLEKLKGVEGYQEILKKALEAKTLWEARKILYEAQIAADTMIETTPYRKIRCLKEGLAVEDPNRVIFITPYDYLDPSPLGDRVLEQALTLKKEESKGSVEIWNGGKVTLSFSSRAFLKGVKTRSWLLVPA